MGGPFTDSNLCGGSLDRVSRCHEKGEPLLSCVQSCRRLPFHVINLYEPLLPSLRSLKGCGSLPTSYLRFAGETRLCPNRINRAAFIIIATYGALGNIMPT